MRPRIILLTVFLLAFYVGASLDFYLRASYGETTDCYCMRARCRIVEIADHPSIFLLHPVETSKLLWTAHRLD